MFAVGHIRSTPSTQESSLFKMPRKSSIVQKQAAVKVNQARELLDNQLNEQKARMKPKTLKCSPQYKNAPAGAKLGSLRGGRGSGSKNSSNGSVVPSPHGAQYAPSKLEKSLAIDSTMPGSTNSSAPKTVAQRLALSALRRQQLKAGSPQLIRADMTKSLQKQPQSQGQERRKKSLYEAQGTSESKNSSYRNAVMQQYGTVQPSAKPKSAFKPKVHTSPDHIERLQGLYRGTTPLGLNSTKKPGNIRLKAASIYNSIISQTHASLDQDVDSILKQSLQSRKDLADSRVDQARPLGLRTESSRQEIKSAFLDKMSANPRVRHERNLPVTIQDADITLSQEHAVKRINVSNKNNKRKEMLNSFDNQAPISEFALQDGLHRLRRRHQQAESQQQSLFVKSQLSLGKVAEVCMSSVNTAEALKTNVQVTADEEEAAGADEDKKRLDPEVGENSGEEKGRKVVGSLAALLGVFGVSSYNGKDFSFSHSGANYQIDIGKLALELHGHALAAGKTSEATKLSLGSLPLLNSVSVTAQEIHPGISQDFGAISNVELNTILRQVGPRTPNTKSQLASTDPLAGINQGVTPDPQQAPRNWLNTDRRVTENQGASLNDGMANKSQRALVPAPTMQLDPAALGRAKNPRAAGSSTGEADSLVQKLNPKRMRSMTNNKSNRSNDQESTGRPASNYSKGFQRVRDQHQDRLKLSRLRTNSRQQLQQRMRSNDSKNPLAHESKSNQGSAAGSAHKQPAFGRQQTPLQVRQMQTEAPNMQNPPLSMGIRTVRSSTKPQGLLDPSLIQAHNQLMEPPRFLEPVGGPPRCQPRRSRWARCLPNRIGSCN